MSSSPNHDDHDANNETPRQMTSVCSTHKNTADHVVKLNDEFGRNKKLQEKKGGPSNPNLCVISTGAEHDKASAKKYH
jgi:hypothetical protein